MTEGHAALEMAILDFYEDAAVLCSQIAADDGADGWRAGGGGGGRGEVQVLPSVAPTYRMLFSNNALAVSRICGVCLFALLLSSALVPCLPAPLLRLRPACPHLPLSSCCLGVQACASM